MSAKLAAKEIRKILKKELPAIKFKVTSDSFSGGDAVRIGWENGVPESVVHQLVEKFEYHTFDAMNDMTGTKNHDFDGPQAKYVQYSRKIDNNTSERIRQVIIDNFWDGITSVQIQQFHWDAVRQLTISDELSDEEIMNCF